MPAYERLSGRAAGLRLWARRRVVPAARAVYTRVERSPLAFLLRVPLVQRLKSRVTYVPEERVTEVMDAIDAAGVRCWLAGGWGIDALLGRETRRHHDLDLVIGDVPDDVARLEQVLAGEGFLLRVRELNPGLLMPVRIAWQDDRGCSVEVMPVDLGKPPFGGTAEGAGEPRFTRGTVGGRDVPCLSASLQFALHEGYDIRGIDRTDMAALRTYVRRTEGAPPA
jgi:lincosamide nucleotidyltransferase A/C/D/E